MATVLIVEDEIDLCNLIRTQLEAEGHRVQQAFDGATALKLVEAGVPDLVILDWMLPGIDGLAVCRQLRKDHLMPIIMLTARNEEVDRVMGLEVGADDYVVKPFSMRELMARVRAILRRVELDSRSLALAVDDVSSSDTLPPAPKPITLGPLHVNPAERIVTLDGAEIDLTPKEYDLLLLLAGHPGRAFSREFLLEHVWGYNYDSADRTVDSHITRLRKKLGPLGEKIITVWGVGYRFVV
jgi:DNA-binding response OmpR family regulator